MLRRSACSLSALRRVPNTTPALPMMGTTALAVAPPTASSASLLQSRRGFVQMNTGSDSTGAGDSNSSRRDQESFLAQYCPLEVLGLYEGETSMRNIVNAYNAKKKAAAGNKYKTTQIERAYSILTDPKSPYFEKASWQQTHRQRLLLELMPDTQRRQAKFYMYGWGSFAIIGVCILAYSMLHPIFRIHRAATRT